MKAAIPGGDELARNFFLIRVRQDENRSGVTHHKERLQTTVGPKLAAGDKKWEPRLAPIWARLARRFDGSPALLHDLAQETRHAPDRSGFPQRPAVPSIVQIGA